MNTLARRSFLRSSVTLVTAAVVLDGSRDAFSSGPRLQFPTQPRDRLCVASYPFRAFIESPSNRERQREQAGMDLKEFAAMVVNRFNVHNIEPLGDH